MPAATLRPNGDISSSGTVSSTGASLWAVTADDSDASYITTSQTTYVLSLGSFSLPAGAMTKTVMVRGRMRANGSGGETAGATAKAQTADGVDVATLTQNGLTLSFVTYSGAPSVAQLTQADIDGLQLRVVGSNPFTRRDGEWYVDVDYATQPAVAVSAPTGTLTDTTAPVVGWAYTAGTDGGAQSRYQVKVFSDAQYGAGGFNPSTSPATWDSGEQLSAATSAVPASLSNGTYRAYVRAAQTVSGQAHWSEWAYSGFAVDVDAPVVDAVTATPDNDNARIRLVVTEDTGAPQGWETIDVERSDDSGATWTPVRGATDTAPVGSTWIGYDWEAPLDTTVVYRARGRAVLPGPAELVGDWTLSNTTSWTSTSAWLKDLYDTTASRAVCIRDWPSQSFPRTQGVHVVVGRADPVVIVDRRRLPMGAFSVMARTSAERTDLMVLLEASVLLLQAPESIAGEALNMYVVPGDVELSQPSPGVSTRRRFISIGYVEVARPVDDLTPVRTGTTWQDLADLGLTWQDLLDAGTTWADYV